MVGSCRETAIWCALFHLTTDFEVLLLFCCHSWAVTGSCAPTTRAKLTPITHFERDTCALTGVWGPSWWVQEWRSPWWSEAATQPGQLHSRGQLHRGTTAPQPEPAKPTHPELPDLPAGRAQYTHHHSDLGWLQPKPERPAPLGLPVPDLPADTAQHIHHCSDPGWF